MLSEHGKLKGKCDHIGLKDGEYVKTVSLDFDTDGID